MGEKMSFQHVPIVDPLAFALFGGFGSASNVFDLLGLAFLFWGDFGHVLLSGYVHFGFGSQSPHPSKSLGFADSMAV